MIPVPYRIRNSNVVIDLFLLTSLVFRGKEGYVSVKLQRLMYLLTILRINDYGSLVE